jgi:predicted permease
MFLAGIWRRAATLLERRRFEQDLDEEILFHLEMETRKHVERGMDPREARELARRAFGGVAAIKEDVRATRGLALADALAQDLRSALRALGRSWTLTLVASVTLALGVGATTALVSALKDVLLRPFPSEDPGRVVVLDGRALSVPEIETLRKESRSLESIAEYHSMPFTLLGKGAPERVDTGVVSADFFDLLRVRPFRGRAFRPGEDALGAEPVLVLGYEYWQARFAGNPSVVGTTIEMNDRPHRVVGVLPPLPQFPDRNDVFMPASSCPFRSARAMQSNLSMRMLGAVARLRSGATANDATREMATLFARLGRSHPEAYRGLGPSEVRAVPLPDALSRRARPALLLLFSAAVFVLLIACANVSSWKLAELASRSRELELRTALGANRLRLRRQLLSESLVLALLGALLGIGLARGLLGLLPALLDRLSPVEISTRLDSGALVLALAIAFAGALAPVLFASLRTGRSWPAGPLVTAQIAISLILLAGAGLTLRSLHRLQTVEPGFVAAPSVVAMHLDLDWHRYRTEPAIRDFHEKLLSEVGTIPGVLSAALGRSVPLSGRNAPDPEAVWNDRGERVLLDSHAVSPEYFRTIGAAVLDGRPFSPTDGPDSEPVAIVNGKAHAILGGGAWIDWAGRRHAIVGIVGDVRQYGLEREAEPSIYFPIAQVPLRVTDLVVAMEGAARPEAIVEIVHRIDPNQAVAFVSTLENRRRESMSAPTLLAGLLSAFAALALTITAIGLSGALALGVERRARELGVRQAMGAAPADVSRLVYRQALRLLLAGTGLGLPAALLLSGALSPQLFDIQPRDPFTFVAVVLVLVLVASAAALVPARRAIGMNPLASLRLEGG